MLMKISKILSGGEKNVDGLPKGIKIDYVIYFKYAPITSVDVECFFSTYEKKMLTDNRRELKFKNIRNYLIMHTEQ